ncbi:MAG: UV damage repair endonuclease UvsE [Desulfobulbaceae bacterium DB1]|nr:MAG: UV damage repair endonuclease UvsE [Desulfobulbaceae bacterium DB1]
MQETREDHVPRFGLCCLFAQEPIKFRSFTMKSLVQLGTTERLSKISDVCLHNSRSLLQALHFCRANGIGAFRVMSPFLPRYTHPDAGYTIDTLPDGEEISRNLALVRKFRDTHDIRLSFHPDQFIVLSSPRRDVVDNAVRELDYQAMLAELIGADVINVHGGGHYGDPTLALSRFADNFRRLPERVQSRLALENDDKIYSVVDLLPLCRQLGIPLIYDVHHHRCNNDGLSEEEATRRTIQTWEHVGREPYFHLSSPRNGWRHANPLPHADYIDLADFPPCWHGLTGTIDVEAKAKELAVIALQQALAG